MSDASLKPDPVGVLAEEFVERLRRGERPSISEYCRTHEELAPRIRELFPSLVMIEQLGPGADESLDSLLFSSDGRRHAAPVRIGDYRILREIGRGGMGVVYEAVQESLGRHVALKVLPRHAAADEKSLERFRGEARTIARLHHTNIVPVFEVDQDEGVSFIAMQYIRGQGLDTVLADLQETRAAADTSGISHTPVLRIPIPSAFYRSGAGDGELETGRLDDLPPELAAGANGSDERAALSGMPAEASSNPSSGTNAKPRRYFRTVAQMGVQVAEALEYAHRRGVVHRDIKPSNLLLDTSGVVWITDFGLAKSEGDALTHTGDIVGTLRYMAPERFTGQSDPRSDVFSLGATLYELLTLRPAFDSTERAQLMQQVMQSDPPRPRTIDPRIPRDLETIVLKAIDRAPAARFASAGQMAEDLRRFLSDQPIKARRTWIWERTWRWCRRNPAIAGSIALTLLAFFLGLGGVVWKWRDAERARQDERAARKAADESAEEVRQGLVSLKEANALLDLGRVLVNGQRWDDADAAFAKALQLRPDDVRASEDRGHLLYARLGLWELAADDLARAFELQRSTAANGWWFHALLRVYVGDTDGYRCVRAEMRQRFGRSYSAYNTADLVRTLALIPAADGIDKDSVKLAEAVVTSHPRHGMFLYVLAVALCRAERYEEAIQRCQQSIQATPPWPAKALNYPILAIAHHALGQDAAARRALDESSKAMSDWTQQMYQQAPDYWVTTLSATGHWPISCWDWLECQLYDREARRRLGIEPVDDPRLHMLRARGFAGLRQLVKADVEYAIALKLSPDDPQIRLEAHRNRAYYAVHKKEFDLAATEFARASALAPNDSDLLRFQAFAFSAAGDVDAYRRVCRVMVARFADTQDPTVAYNVVDACIVQPDAIEDLTQLIPLAKLGATWYVGGIRMLGAAHCRAGQFDDAVRCYQEAAEVTPLRAWDWGVLALAHERLGNADEAQRCLIEAATWIDDANRQKFDDLTATHPVWGGWYESMNVQRLLLEARTLIDRDRSLRPEHESSLDHPVTSAQREDTR